MDIKQLSTEEKVSLLKDLYHDIAGKGRRGDTQLAHINSVEAELLRAAGGSGTINPATGLHEYGPVKAAVSAVSKVVSVATDVAEVVAPFVATATGNPYLMAAKFGYDMYSANRQRKAQKQSISLQRSAMDQRSKSDANRQKYNQLQFRKQRIAALRQGRLERGRIEGYAANSGVGDSSSQLGAVASVNTQTAAAIGDFNTAQGFGDISSGFNQTAGNMMSAGLQQDANAMKWKNMSDTVDSVYKKLPEIGDAMEGFSSDSIFT
tara:strand:- start:404 stop:1195 length:792 start_codon:yes stop_codon:yes gene_type:complete